MWFIAICNDYFCFLCENKTKMFKLRKKNARICFGDPSKSTLMDVVISIRWSKIWSLKFTLLLDIPIFSFVIIFQFESWNSTCTPKPKWTWKSRSNVDRPFQSEKKPKSIFTLEVVVRCSYILYTAQDHMYSLIFEPHVKGALWSFQVTWWPCSNQFWILIMRGW